MPRYPNLWLACRTLDRQDRHGPVDIDVRRAQEAAMWAARPVPDDGLQVADHLVAAGGHDVPVRVYRRPGADPLPAHVLLHGGAFTTGGIPQVDALSREYALAADCVVVNVDYRRAPEHPWPAAPEDGYAALQWTAARPDVDAARVSVGGVSVGGGMAAAIALMARDRDGVRPVFQLVEIPAIDLTLATRSMDRFATGYLLTRAQLERAVSLYCPDPADRRHPYASPALAPDLSGLPPAYVVVAQYDPLRDEGETYARRLREAGVPVELVVARGHIHSSTYSAMRSARRHRARAAAALRAALHA